MKNKLKKGVLTTLKYLLIAAAWLGIWQLAYLAVGRAVLLPSPKQTLRTLCALAKGGELWRAVGSSLLRIMLGFLIGMAAGCLLAVVTSCSRLLRDFFQPLMVITKTTPVASFIILAVVLFKTGSVTAFTVSLNVAPIFWSNKYTGIVNTDPALLEMARMYRFSRWNLVTKLYLQSVLPYFYSAVTVGIGMAWKSGVAAEVICNPKGSVGSALYESKIYFETEKMFAWTVVVIILSVLLERTIIGALDKTLGRRSRIDKAE